MEAVPPAVRYRVTDVLALLPTDGGELEGVSRERLARVLDDGEGWIGADPTLAEVGYWMIEPRHASEHRLRAIRLVAAVIGEEAVPLLLARAAQAQLDDRLEMLFMVVALAGEAKLGVLDDAIRGTRFADLLRQRAKWHLQHRGVVPTV